MKDKKAEEIVIGSAINGVSQMENNCLEFFMETPYFEDILKLAKKSREDIKKHYKKLYKKLSKEL